MCSVIFFNNFRNFRNIGLVILFYSGIKNVFSNWVGKKMIIYINVLKLLKLTLDCLKINLVIRLVKVILDY